MKSTHYTRMDEDEDEPMPLSGKCCLKNIFPALILMMIIIAISFVVWKMYLSGNGGGGSPVVVSDGAGSHMYPPPPPHTEYAQVARYIIHISDWAALATESTHPTIEGYPFANVFSISDGTLSNSSGTPYFYLTSMDLSVHDLEKDPRASLTASLAQSDYCSTRDLDPEDPVCAHVILTGEMVKVVSGSSEEAFAREALFTRHPEMTEWPQKHGWFFARLAIRHIYLLDFFGGTKVVTPEDYFAVIYE